MGTPLVNMLKNQRKDLERKEAIRKICEKRKITELIHFTHIKNLSNIFREGLIGRKELESHPEAQKFVFNDEHRLDGHPEAICLSVSFPNYQMFFSYNSNNRNDWVVISLNPDILWELDCAFYTENASSTMMTELPLELHKKSFLFKNFFEDYDGVKRSPKLPDCYPTHPQAEVLVFERIPSSKIMRVYFYSLEALENWYTANPNIDPGLLTVDQTYFNIRHEADKPFWKQKYV